MIDSIIAGSDTFQILEKALNASAMQHKMISNNIANVDTPGYKGSEVVFQSKLQEALNNMDKSYLPLTITNPKHISIAPEMTLKDVEPTVVTRTETTSRNDGNNVDIDTEMARLAENTTYYASLAQLMTLKLSNLKSVILEGRR